MAIHEELTEKRVRKGEAPAFYTDALTEARIVDGIIYLSLGSRSIDGEDEELVDVVTRLRMNLSKAKSIHANLEVLIKQAMRPFDYDG